VTGEFLAIDRLISRLPGISPDAAARGEVWIGDDAAAVTMPTAPWLLLAADAVVAGV
jgi:thiamine monophosphate kinase